MTNHPVITGIGVVSPVGIGKEAFWNALTTNISGIKEITKFDATRYPYNRAAEVIDFSAEDFLSDQNVRRTADISRYAIGAVSMAIEDAALKGLDSRRTSLVMGITHGAINMSREFHKGLVSGDGASPMLFSDSVLNAPAGNISVCFGLKGASHTLIGGAPIGISAISIASDLLKTNRADIAIVGGAEELDEVIHYGYSKFDYLFTGKDNKNEWTPFGVNRKGFVMGEGAGSLILERKKDAIKRGADIYAEICGWNSGFFFNGNDEVLANTMSTSLDMGKLSPDSIGYISSGANGTSLDYLEAKAIKTLFQKNRLAPFIGSIKPNIGEAFSAATILQVISASLIMKKGMVPSNINLSSIHPEWHGMSIPTDTIKTPVKAAIVNSIGIEGRCASVAIKNLEV